MKNDDQARGLRLLLRAKSNIGPGTGGFEYELHEAELPRHPGIRASGVLWDAPLEGSARELLSAAEASDGSSDDGALSKAKLFLRDLLSDGAMPAKKISRSRWSRTLVDVDLSRKDRAGCRSHQTRYERSWVWALPA